MFVSDYGRLIYSLIVAAAMVHQTIDRGWYIIGI